MPFKIITVDELISLLDKYNHRELHIHHTYQPDHADFDGKNHIKLQDGMRKYHVEVRNFQAIAQHVTLFPDGKFVTGREFGKDPASIKYHNDLAFCVEMLGNFDKDKDKLEGKQKESIIKLAKYFDKRKKYIRFHNENAPKSCPGSAIDKIAFMKEVKAKAKIVYNFKPCKFNDEGEHVKALQAFLHIKQDGVFGRVTEKAVKEFQTKNKLKADGIVGAKTIAKLKG